MLNALQQPPTFGAGAGTVGGLGTTSKIFAYNSANNPSLAGIAYALPINGSNKLHRILFDVRASGDVFCNQTETVTVTAFGVQVLPALANQLTPGSYTILGASTARSVTGPGWASWFWQADLIFSSNSGKLEGRWWDQINNLVDAPAALTNQLTALVGVTEPVFFVVIGITFSVSDALNLANIVDFGITPA